MPCGAASVVRCNGLNEAGSSATVDDDDEDEDEDDVICLDDDPPSRLSRPQQQSARCVTIHQTADCFVILCCLLLHVCTDFFV